MRTPLYLQRRPSILLVRGRQDKYLRAAIDGRSVLFEVAIVIHRDRFWESDRRRLVRAIGYRWNYAWQVNRSREFSKKDFAMADCALDVGLVECSSSRFGKSHRLVTLRAP